MDPKPTSPTTRTEESKPQSTRENAALDADRPLHVLVVDDQHDVREVLSMGLAHYGFAVCRASGGREAIELYRDRRQELDLVLLDVLMPGLDGPQTLRALREVNPDVRCCFLSGGLGKYNEVALRDMGALAVFSKPIKPSVLAQMIRYLIHGMNRNSLCSLPSTGACKDDQRGSEDVGLQLQPTPQPTRSSYEPS